MKIRSAVLPVALLLGATISMTAMAQNAPRQDAPAQGGNGEHERKTPASRAIEFRQSLFTVISGNMAPIGGLIEGRGAYNAAEFPKRAERNAFLATMVGDAFPEVSKTGDTKAKAEVWSDPQGFSAKVKAFVDASANLAAVVKADNTNSAAFKAAATKVENSCKGCHDDFRAK